MAFEESPQFENNSLKTRSSFRGWVSRHARLLIFLTASILLINLVFLAFLVLPVWASPPGGVDGCLASPDGTPILASVSIGKNSKATSEEGCFFFVNLKSGWHTMTIITADGQTYKRSIEIISDQALELGTVQLAP